jgi:hypothetical protein
MCMYMHNEMCMRGAEIPFFPQPLQKLLKWAQLHFGRAHAHPGNRKVIHVGILI